MSMLPAKSLFSEFQQQYVAEHVWLAEKVIGKRLPAGALVHHVDENHKNNKPFNLVICPNPAYHRLLHTRQAAFDATGDYDKRKCTYCSKYDSKDNLRVVVKAKYQEGQWYHRGCKRAYRRQYYEENKR